MIVSELMEILRDCNCNAEIEMVGEGFMSQDGTWLEGDRTDLNYVYPTKIECRRTAKLIILE